MQLLANFVAMGARQQRQQRNLMHEATAAAKMANDLAHQINNPLQSLTNVVFLATEDKSNGGEQRLALKLRENWSAYHRW